MRRRRSFPLFAVLGLVLAACTTTQSSPSASPGGSGGGTATGGQVRIGMGGYPDSLNPGNGLLSEAYTMYELVYDTPIAVDASGAYVPELATDWSVSDDGLTWTMTIRDDATFHDGEPLTAEDVAYSIQLYRDTPEFPYLPSYASYFEDIQAPDETHVTLTTAEPLGNFEANVVFMYVLPKHIWEPAIAGAPCADASPPPDASAPPPCGAVAFQNEEMIGSGPFKINEVNQSEEYIVLDANKDYWGLVPSIDSVIFQKIENADSRVTALTTNNVDAITEFPATAVSALRNEPNINVSIADVAAGGSLRDVFFNMVADEDCPEGGVCSGHPALKDVAVRRALATAMDKQQIIDVATLGTSSLGLSLVPPGLGDFYANEVADYPFDIDAANQMLDDAGYEDTDDDGVRECLSSQDCDDLTFRFYFADDIDTAPRETELIAATWEQIGVAVEIQAIDAENTLTSLCCPSFDYDIIMWGWGSDPDPAFLLGVALCTEIDSGFSETGYCNPDYDELYAAQGVETDHDARVEQIHEMQQILMDDVPYIVPYYQQQVEAWRTDTFTGWIQNNPTLGIEDPSNLSVLQPAE
jgi:peptide/nickel transport system substrate-binding protein